MSFSPFEVFLTECRVAGQIARETLMGLKRSRWMNLVIVVTMASILSILGVAILFLMDVASFARDVGTELEISAYVQDKASSIEVESDILALPHVQESYIIDKQVAWDELRSYYDVPMDENENPLPDTIRIKVDEVKNIPALVQQIKDVKGVEEVQYAKNVVEKVMAIARGATYAGFIIGTFLFTLTMFVIGNTIHLLIESKSREIEILRMMGLGNWYIRLPFIFQGATYGLGGALIAFIPIWIANHFILQFINYFEISVEPYSISIVSLIILLVGVAVGSSGAVFAVRKYLHI